MRLLDTESLTCALQNSGISIDREAESFYSDLWSLIKSAENITDDTGMAAVEKELRQLCRSYFRNAGRWVRDMRAQQGEANSCALGRRLQGEAEILRPAFEKRLRRYVLCYMHLNRALVRARRDMKGIIRDDDNEHSVPAGLEISDSTGLLLARAWHQKKELTAKRERLLRAQSTLGDMDSRFSALQKSLQRAMGRRGGEKAYTAFHGALRKGDEGKVRACLDSWRQIAAAAAASGWDIFHVVQKHASDLAVYDGYILDTSEIKLIFSFLADDEERVDRFLDKYNLAYMAYKFKHLLQLGYRLGQIGSLEGLLVLHARTIGGIAHPLSDIAQARRYESDILSKVIYLVRNGFSDLPHIFDDMEVTAQQLRVLCDQTRTGWALRGKHSTAAGD